MRRIGALIFPGFELLLTPQGGDQCGPVAERRAAALDRRMYVEQGAVGVEDAGGDIVEGGFAHGRSVVRIDVGLGKPVAAGKATVLQRLPPFVILQAQCRLFRS